MDVDIYSLSIGVVYSYILQLNFTISYKMDKIYDAMILLQAQQQPVFMQQPPLQHSLLQVSPCGQHCSDPLHVVLH